MLLAQKYQTPARLLHRRTRRKPVPHSQRLLTMHWFATIIRDLVIRRVCAETPVPSLQTVKPAQGSDSCVWRAKRDTEIPKLSRLLFVGDKRNKCNYLIHTGAAVSVLPRSCANRAVDDYSLPLVAANISTITIYGTDKRIVDVGLKREYSWTFIVADVKQPILGADFLIHYNLLVDLSGHENQTGDISHIIFN